MSLVSGLENTLGINTTAGTSQLQDALNAIQGVNTPTQQQLTLPQLQQYVQAGLLTAQDAQAILANQNTYQNTLTQNENTQGQAAQSSALQQMQDLYKNGGSNAINQAQLLNNLNQVKQQINSQNQAVQQNAQSRGVAGGGLEFISQLLNNQSGAQNANSNAVNAAGNNAQLALQALSGAGSLGSTMQSQSNQQAQAAAQAAQQVAEYNSQLGTQTNLANTQMQNAANAYNVQNQQNLANQNTGLANYTTQYNAQIPETVYQNQMGKAQNEANIYGNQANLAEQQAQQNNSFIGNLIGAGATMGGSYLGGKALGTAMSGMNSGGGMAAGNNPYATNPSVYPGYQQNSASIGDETFGNSGQPFAKGGMVMNYDNGGQIGLRPGGDVVNEGGNKNQGSNSHKGISLGDILAILGGVTGAVGGGYLLNKKFGQGSNPGINLPQDVGNTLGNAAVPQSDPNPDPQMMANGGFCYFNGGKVNHDHAICMKQGGGVPGMAKVPGNSLKNDTVPAMVSPGEIVLPRSVTQSPNAPAAAAQFVNHVKNPTPASGNFHDVLTHLANNGLEMHVKPARPTQRI